MTSFVPISGFTFNLSASSPSQPPLILGISGGSSAANGFVITILGMDIVAQASPLNGGSSFIPPQSGLLAELNLLFSGDIVDVCIEAATATGVDGVSRPELLISQENLPNLSPTVPLASQHICVCVNLLLKKKRKCQGVQPIEEYIAMCA